jgi:hypothetical protein
MTFREEIDDFHFRVEKELRKEFRNEDEVDKSSRKNIKVEELVKKK